jgi:hypothetical protein
MQESVTTEIEALHDFFARWFNGACAVEVFDREFVGLFDPSFTMVVPSGSLLVFDRLCSGLMTGYGQSHGFAIAIRDVSVVAEDDNVVVARYQELQVSSRHSADARNARWSTVVFARDPSCRNGLRWMFVHETALPLSQLPEDAFAFAVDACC